MDTVTPRPATSAATPGDGWRVAGLREALASAVSVLEDHAAALDRLDAPAEWDEGAVAEAAVAPPGSGSDLAAALGGAVDAAGDARDFAQLATRLADGARAGASARPGQQLAVLLEGAGEVLCNLDVLDGTRLALALEAGAERLVESDRRGRPGSLPAVAGAAADGALAAADEGAGLADVVVAAADAGLAELEEGPVADPRLARLGVVDAAAAGFLLVLDVLAGVATGEPLPAPPLDAPDATERTAHRYEVACLLEPGDGEPLELSDHLEASWRELGELVRFQARGERWSLCLHTGLPGAAVEALVEVGRPRDLRIAVLEPTGPGRR